MDKSKGIYKAHAFVCTNDKKTSTCRQRGAEELRQALKDWTSENPEWKKRIRINASGCLNKCQDGIAIAIYPQNIWLTDLRPQDLHKVQEEIRALMAIEYSDAPPTET